MFALIRLKFKETLSIVGRFRGNAKGVVITEPLWGIPFNLYIAYTSVYMIALGCTDTQVGLIESVSLSFQMIFALLGGHVTDRLGRKRTTIIFDLIGWSIPTLIWAAARNFNYFLVAAIINSAFRVVHTSWTCLFVEDTEPEQRVHVYTWIHMAGILAGFFAPLAGYMVKTFSLIPAVRGLYVFAFFSMTTMFFLRNHLVHETRTGLQKIKETDRFRFRDTLREYRRILKELVKSPLTLVSFVLLVLNNIHMTIRRTFFPILLTKGLGFAKESIAIFPAIHSLVMLFVFLFVMPTLGRFDPKKPLLAGLISSFAGYLILVFTRGPNFFYVITSTALSAFGMAVVFPFIESILANSITDIDRAKVISILHVFLFGASAPIAYIGGVLSSISENLPFVLILGFTAISMILVFFMARLQKNIKRSAPESE